MITIVNTGVANISSVLFACERMGKVARVSQNKDEISACTHVILPGVGTASASMANLARLGLVDCIQKLKQPTLGICLGMQLMFESSEEGNVKGLGHFKGHVRRLSPMPNFAIPHMGWNQVSKSKESLLLAGIPNETHFYFVHSFRAPEGDETVAISLYSERIPAVIERSNWFGTQFHPERSGEAGAQLLKNFLSL